jgi:feruloyl esterase
MFNERAPSSRALGDRVRAASQHRGPWPKVSVWHGTADAIVKPSNADHSVKQWLNVQGLSEAASREDYLGRHLRRRWNDANGDALVESITVAGMQHGVPLASGDANCDGRPGPFFLEAGISSTWHIAGFWGLTAGESAVRSPERASRAPAPLVQVLSATQSASPQLEKCVQHEAGSRLNPNAVIAAAFQAAGLPSPAGSTRERSWEVDPCDIIDAALKAAGIKR